MTTVYCLIRLFVWCKILRNCFSVDFGENMGRQNNCKDSSIENIAMHDDQSIMLPLLCLLPTMSPKQCQLCRAILYKYETKLSVNNKHLNIYISEDEFFTKKIHFCPYCWTPSKSHVRFCCFACTCI